MKKTSFFLLLLTIFWHDVVCKPHNVSTPEEEPDDEEVEENIHHQYNAVHRPYSIPRPMDCSEVLLNRNTKNGFYTIYPRSRTLSCSSFDVYCDMETDGTGWTVIQRRGDYKNPANYFFKPWSHYKKGFGSLEKEFWLGNDKIHAISNQGSYKIRFDLRHLNGTFVRDQYEMFWIENEDQKYKLHIEEYSGNGSDAMIQHNNQPFTTKDRDNANKCGATRTGGWWFFKTGTCLHANLNGLNTQGNATYDTGILWSAFSGWHTSLAYTEIKIQATTAM